MSQYQAVAIEESPANFISGWIAAPIWLVVMIATLWNGYSQINASQVPIWEGPMVFLLLVVIRGFAVIPPNMASVLTFFGKYNGSILESGFFCCNPLSTRRMVSLRINNFTTETIKVNDMNGNPIEIGSVISWRVSDTAKAAFAVNDATSFVEMACESAIREVASSRVYDHSLDEAEKTRTLRGDLEGVANDLESTIGEHVAVAGIEIISAKITHLAYAPEIAMAMLRKQQATAVVAARKQIVEGAVGMVREALEQISAQKIVELDSNQKAALVSNLLTVLVSESETQPVLTLNKS